MPSVVLRPGHVQPIWAGHPWVYAQAIERIEGGATAGDEVAVLDPRGNHIGRGFYSPGSAIPVRICVRDTTTRLDASWLRDRLSRAHELRHELGLPTADTNGYRLEHSEGDMLPGLVVDRFGDVAAVQLLTIGFQVRREEVLDAIEGVFGVRTIVDRTPSTHSEAEGFRPTGGVVRGVPTFAQYCFTELGLRYELPIELGQKTGYYFDQRLLRQRMRELSRGRRVLDLYSYVGSMAMAAAQGGASMVKAVDESALALEVAARCAAANGLADEISFVRSSARNVLADARGQNLYDLIIADPPSMAPSQRNMDRALHAYRKLAAAAAAAVRPGGIFALCSCSAAIGLDALTRAVALGARDSATSATVVERWFQGPDHPVPAAFQEGLYLKSVVARVGPP